MESTSFSDPGADTFFALYGGAFNAASPLNNLLQVDDDGGAGALSLITRALQANTQYFLVFTTFGNGDYGAYTGVFDTVGGGAGQVILGALDASTVDPSSLPAATHAIGENTRISFARHRAHGNSAVPR